MQNRSIKIHKLAEHKQVRLMVFAVIRAFILCVSMVVWLVLCENIRGSSAQHRSGMVSMLKIFSFHRLTCQLTPTACSWQWASEHNDTF